MDGFGYGNRQPVMQRGTIDIVVAIDLDQVERQKSNTPLTVGAKGCYPFGTEDLAHNAMPRDTLLINNKKMIRSANGPGYMQYGIVGLNGLEFDDSQMKAESMFVWGGICQTEQKLVTPDYGTQDAMHQGVTSYVAGKFSIPWRSTKEVCAGDRIMWCLPPQTPEVKSGAVNPMPLIPGSHPRQFQAMYEPYVPTDFTVQLAGGAVALMGEDNHGIHNVPYNELAPGNANKPSAERKVAAALKYGLLGAAMAVIEVLLTKGILTKPAAADVTPIDEDEARDEASALAKQVGLLNPATSATVRELIAAILLSKDKTDNGIEAVTAFGGTNELLKQADYAGKEATYENIRFNAVDFLLGGLAAAVDHKRSRVVGMALESAKPGADVAVIFGAHCAE